MALWTEDVDNAGARASLPFPKMLTIDDVQGILNLGKPMVYALLRSGDLRGAQFGPRGIWRIRQDDLSAYIDAVYENTAAHIAAGQLPAAEVEEEQ
ncbi:helix-turn-helix domain-containing protein [Arthrobacter bambusae]|uniref:helix-turn-helix domain-containing protein n=1 Tax=Arthrobacter bambusae TaxID=1338426 RepID=UPI002782BE59|nr:helix-turn-helix domain-containing protein [Arthrobacter bambusae]MDQ0031512.1 excisionase family DNA binding protein [Arthrobacter bambusae]MDQ0099735.1 excisionase family DNA binding protein [Arthrobacter bambusae]